MHIASSTDRETRGIWKHFPAASAQARPRRAHDRFLSRPDISTNSSKGSNKIHFRVAARVHIYIPSGRKIPRLPRRPGGCGGCRALDLHIAREHGVQRCAGGTACEGIWRVFRIGRSSCLATDSISRLYALIRLAFSMRPTAFVTRSIVSKIDTKTRVSRPTGERGTFMMIGRSTPS